MSEKLTIEQLFDVVKAKIQTKEAGSYCNEIASQGVEKVTRKIGEEATETIIAAFLHDQNPDDKNRQDLVGEVCDLIFHNLILLAKSGIDIEEILTEFAKRAKKHD